MSKYSVLGQRVHRVDGPIKVTGRACYTADMVLPNMLYGKILRSPHPHANIISIDTSRAEKFPGVMAVVTGKDTIGRKLGNWERFPEMCDEEILCRSKVRYVGDPVAAVAAIDEDTAEEALDLIEVEYEVLPAVFEPLEAIKEGAPQIHEGIELNINVTRHLEWGDVDEAFKQCDHIREDTFRTNSQAHISMETHCAIADFGFDGKLTMWTSTQSLAFIKVLLARAFGLREGDVRVIAPPVGGGYGSKFEIDSAQFCATLLSMKLHQPVKIVLTREEEFIATKRRTPMYFHIRLGVKKDGTLLAKEVRIMTEGGAYTGMGPTALYLAGFFSSFPYQFPNYRYDGYRVYTNTAPTSALRGFGATQAAFAGECQIDMMAEDLGIDKMELRRKNGMTPNYVVPGQAFIQSCGLQECLDRVDERIKAKGKLPPNHYIGFAASGHVSGQIFNFFNTPNAFSSAMVRINSDGHVDLYTGQIDIGQGSNTVMAMICAEELGVRLEDVTVRDQDSSVTPFDVGAFSSRGTLMSGNAVRAAAADAKRQLLDYAYARLGANIIYDVDFRDRWAYNIARPERRVSYFEIVKDAIRAKQGQAIVGRGTYTPRRKGMITPAYSFAVQAVEIEVDPETGRYKLVDVINSHDCGTILNPVAVEGQIDGAVMLGAGLAFCEDQPMDDGKILNPSMADYKLIRSIDMPPTMTLEIDTFEPEGPFGAKEASEGLNNPTPAAIANAIYNGLGVRITDLPITPEKVFNALKEKKKQAKKSK